MPTDTSNTSKTLNVTSTSNYVWFDVRSLSVAAIEIDAANASGGWALQVLRSARQSGDVGYAFATDLTFSASGISEPFDITGCQRVGVKVTSTGTGSVEVFIIAKADR